MKKRDDLYIAEIQKRIEAIKKHLKGVPLAKFLKSELHQSALIRELEVVGEAAKNVSEDTKKKFNQIPWQQMIGMRNKLIHEYFGVDLNIIWEVSTIHLPQIEEQLEKVFLETAPPSHPWRNCPLGYHYVRSHIRNTKNTNTEVNYHCRKNPSRKDQLYPEEIKLISQLGEKSISNSKKVGPLSHPANANNYDSKIVLWTQYWNDILKPTDELHPNIVKALFYSESSFNLNTKAQKVSNRNYARGPLQITDNTRKILSDEKGELQNHFLTLTADDVRDIDNSLAAAIRWLFHKKNLASRILQHEANWIEAIAAYKSYLKKNKDYTKEKGMKNFFSTLLELENK